MIPYLVVPVVPVVPMIHIGVKNTLSQRHVVRCPSHTKGAGAARFLAACHKLSSGLELIMALLFRWAAAT